MDSIDITDNIEPAITYSKPMYDIQQILDVPPHTRVDFTGAC
jgi:hypothetical protein